MISRDYSTTENRQCGSNLTWAGCIIFVIFECLKGTVEPFPKPYLRISHKCH